MSEELMDEFELITITSEDGTEEFFAEADSVEYEGKSFVKRRIPFWLGSKKKMERKFSYLLRKLNLMPSLPSLKKHRLKKRNN